MATYKFKLCHQNIDDSADNYAKLVHEYDNIDTALHLFCITKDYSPSLEASPINPLSTSIEVTYFDNTQEAKQFIIDFLTWLNTKISIEFCPDVILI